MNSLNNLLHFFFARSLPSAFAFLAAVALSSPTASAQERREIPSFRTYGHPATTQDAAAIDALIEDFRDAWARQDTAAIVALHAEDVEWINAYGRLIRGAAPLGEFFEKRLFPAFSPEVSKQEANGMKKISVRYLGPDSAVVHTYTEGERGASRVAGETRRSTYFHLVVSKQNQAWKIVHVAIMDAR